MIPFNFVYLRPDTPREAVDAYTQMMAEGKSPLYYGGGSEIITMSRAGSIRPGAVIDLKAIPECLTLEKTEDSLIIGGAVTLNKIAESKIFPLLGKACGRIADHTNQCRITLGGNLCATIIYRETSLPLMLADAEVVLFGPDGERRAPMSLVFDKRLRLVPGEFVMQVIIPDWILQLPYVHVKKTANEKIDYPLVSIAAVKIGEAIRIAFSGVCSYPFRSVYMEEALNDNGVSKNARIEEALRRLPETAYADVEGSSDYRLFVLKNTLMETLEALNG